MSSWGKKIGAFFGFKKKKSKVQQPKAVRTNVGGGTDEEEIADEMEKRRQKIAMAGGKGQIDFSGLLGGGGRGLG